MYSYRKNPLYNKHNCGHILHNYKITKVNKHVTYIKINDKSDKNDYLENEKMTYNCIMEIHILIDINNGFEIHHKNSGRLFYVI